MSGFWMGWRSVCALTLVILLWPGDAGAGDAEASCRALVPGGSFSIRVFRDTDGLPQDTIQSLALDTRGYLWAATQDGAAYYDGRVWRPVPLPERALEDDFIRCVLGASDGSVWLGTRSNGLYRLYGESWTWYRGQFVGAGYGRVNALLETRSSDGTAVLWVGTHRGGVARFDGRSWIWLTTAQGLPSNEVWGLGRTTSPDGEVTIWVGTDKGVARLLPGSSRFEQEAGFPRDSVNSFLVTRDEGTGREVLWAGSYGSGLYRFEDGTWSRLTRKDGLGSRFLTSLAASRNPQGSITIWAGTDGGGVARIVDGRVRMLGVDDGFPSNAAYSLLTTTAEQGAEAVWIGMRNGGLVRLMEGKWQRAWPGPVGRIVPVLSVARSLSPSGCPEYWVGTDGAGLHHWSAGAWKDTPALRNATVQCLLTGSDGTVWAGMRTAGLAEIRGGRIRIFSRGTCAIGCDMIQALAEVRDEAGVRTIWIGTRQGLYTLRRGTVRRIPPWPELQSQSVSVLLPAVGPGGEMVLWAGIGGRLARLGRDGWRIFDREAGLYRGQVQCLMVRDTPSGQRLWVGTDGAGVAVLDISGSPRHLFSLRAANPAILSNDVVYWIGEDRQRRVYILTNRGVTRLTPTEAEPKGPAAFEATIFTAEDGLPSNQGSRGAGIVEASGRILVGTADGCALLDPALARPDRVPKKLDLAAHLEGPSPKLLQPGCRLAFDNKHIRFEATLLSLFRGWDTRYRTELAGFDATPSRWKVEGGMEYRNLPPGAYSFRVWGRDYAGNISGPVEFPFEVQPAPWQTWWAQVILLLLVAGLIWGAVNLRMRAVRARERRLASLVELRTQELAEANSRLEELAREDPLTGLANRRAFDEALSAEWRRAQRSGEPLALVLVDIDGFKAWNDSYGHPAGDAYLRSLGDILNGVTERASDLAARIGGDEFAVLLPGTSLEGAVSLAEEICRRLEKAGSDEERSEGGAWPTVSCGVAVSRPGMSGRQELLELADRCLYGAKEMGGRCVVSLPDLEAGWPL